MFYGSKYFLENKLIRLGNSITNMSYMFYNCTNYSGYIYGTQKETLIIPESTKDTSYMFAFNNLQVISNRGTYLYNEYKNSSIFMVSPSSYISMITIFPNYGQLNIPVNIGSNVQNTSAMFMNQALLDENVTLGENVVDMSYMFAGCTNFNKNITIPDSVLNADHAFDNMTNFHSHIYFGNGIKNFSNYFRDTLFNAYLHISGDVKDMSNMFANCNIFNKEFTIPDSTLDCMFMFNNCRNLNSTITIGKNVKNAYYMFGYCNTFDKDMVIPENVTNMNMMFCNANNMFSNIYIKKNNGMIDTGYMVNKQTGYTRRQNIYFANEDHISNSQYRSVTGDALTFTITREFLDGAYRNVYYNSSRKLYLYNYIPPGI